MPSNTIAAKMAYRNAEGIESQGQLDKLIEVVCDYGQEFLFSQAIPVENFESFLKQAH